MKSMQLAEQLTIFTRYPEPGRTKTRLISALGKEGAAALQKELTEKTVQKIDQLLQAHPVQLVIYFEGGDLASMQSWLGPERIYKSQGHGDLGEKLKNAFAHAFRTGVQRMITIGCDCPELTIDHISRAFNALRQKDLVLGPAIDGGYYLIGLHHPADPLFEDIPWGTDKVFETAVTQAQKLGLSIETLEELRDVDRPEDLEYFNYHPDPE